MPVARAAAGCLVALVAIVGLMLLVRPAIFSIAPPRDDTRVVVATATEASAGPLSREIVLSRSRGLDGERPVEGGHVQVTVVVAPIGFATYSVVNAASPVEDACPVEIAGDGLVDCAGRAWTLDGQPIDAGLEPLQRFAVTVRDGGVVADLTRLLPPGG